jgi:uncharacterized alkaline shock family protein YloU
VGIALISPDHAINQENVMTETSSQPSSSGSPAAGTASAPRGSGGRLSTDKGTTSIADVVVTKVAGIAAREVGGVHALGGAVARALGAVTQRLGTDSNTQGVSVEVTDEEARVSVTVIIDYGESIPDVAQQIRDNIIRRLEAITGLTVAAVDVAVTDLYFPGDDDDSSSSAA